MAQLHLNSISDAHNRKDLENTLHSLPDGLDDAYSKTLDRIRKQTKKDAVLAERILSWISLALRPLTTKELQHALVVVEDGTSIDEQMITHEEILISVCCGFVVIDRESSIIRLVHFTLREHLSRQQHNWKSQANLASSCLQYLSFDVFAHGPCKTDNEMKERMNDYPLLVYAASYWGEHARKAGEPDQSLMRFILNFLDNKETLASSKQADEVDLPRHLHHRCGSQCYPQEVTGLQVAASFGLEAVVCKLLDQGAQLMGRDSYGRTAFDIAALRGQDRVVLLLLNSGVDLSPDEGNGTSALQCAALNGRTTTMKLLVERGVGINSVDIRFAALHIASREGHKEAVEWLLKNGAEVNLKGKLQRTPLHFAAESGHNDVASVLIDNGGDILVRDEAGSTPLHLACQGGDVALVQMLLSRGSSTEDRTATKETPLMFASRWAHLGVVKLLLDHGADVLATSEDGITTLHAAMQGFRLQRLECGHKSDGNGLDVVRRAIQDCCGAIVRLLISAGADINAEDNKSGGTPLMWASRIGLEMAVRHLIESGAKLECPDRWGFTPLIMAVVCGSDSIVEILLDAGASIESPGQSTALHVAAHWGQLSISQILLNKGARISATDKSGRTALHSLASRRQSLETGEMFAHELDDEKAKDLEELVLREAREHHITIANLLLNAHANIDAIDEENETPLFLAARNNHESLFRHFLTCGADARITNLKGESVLHVAATSGNDNILRILLENGPDLEAVDKLGVPALYHACIRQNNRAAELLLQHGANVNARYPNVPTALHLAARSGNESIVRLLLDHKADVDAVDERGSTPLHYTAYMLDLEKLEELMRSREPTDLAHLTAYLYATMISSENVYSLLVARGADENSKDSNGLSAQQAHSRVLQLILGHLSHSMINLDLTNES